MNFNFSLFEIIMLICFGASWPVAIIKTLRVKTVKGVSVIFCILVFIGYIAGTTHKLIFSRDIVIFLYIFNCFTVGIQTFLVLYYSFKNKKLATP